jgi:outer membrane protein OmpA-like peptidoglycan-associated protein
METYIKSKGLLCLILYLFLLLPGVAFSHIKESESYRNNFEIRNLEKGYYLVVGAFSKMDNAVRFTEKLNNKGYDANIGKVKGKDYLYVYINSSEDLKEISEYINNPRVKEIGSMWILNVDTEGHMKVMAKPEEQHKYFELTNKEEEAQQISEIYHTERQHYKKEEKLDPNGKKEYYLYFRLLNVRSFKELNGMIEIWRGEQAKQIGSLPANEIVTIERPNYEQKSFQLICDEIGFRRLELDINLDNPINDSTFTYVEMHGDTIVVNFELLRLGKGDIDVIFDIYFHSDAAIMKGQSKYALEKIVEMMEENKNMKILIHGHTNSNRFGKIKSLEDGSTEFFHLSPKNKSGYGNAKKLSLLRAQVIKQYLIFRGIEPERLMVKGWGGKKELFDPYHIDARKNARVEIEVVRE